MGANLAPIGRATTIPQGLYSAPKLNLPLKLRLRADAFTICHPELGECGVLDKRSANILTTLIKDDPALQFEALPDLDSSTLSSQRRKPMSILPLEINVYGPFASMDKVATALSEAKVFLQEPTRVHPSSAYSNPHFLSWDNRRDTPQLRQTCVLPLVDMRARVHEILHQSNDPIFLDLPRQDCRISTVLHKSVFRLIS